MPPVDDRPDEASAARAALRSTLDALPADARDAWVDDLLGLDVPDDDGADLPRGCVPYLPCAVHLLLQLIDDAAVRAADVFVDVGSGTGRALALVHRLTGADAIGIEVQSHLVDAARRTSPGLTTLHGDALDILPLAHRGTVFFFYCPFSGDRLERALDHLESIARDHAIRLCTVDLPVLRRPWLRLISPPEGSLLVYRSAMA